MLGSAEEFGKILPGFDPVPQDLEPTLNQAPDFIFANSYKTCYNDVIMELISIAIIGTVILLASLVVIGVVYFMGQGVNRRWNNHKIETIDRWAAEGVEFAYGPAASQFGGLESMGHNVTRGIGYALLTPADLRVTCAIPHTQWWAVPFKQITEVTLAYNFLGKSAKQTPYILIHYKKDNDNIDRLGFQVKDAETWAKEVANAAGVMLENQS